MFISCEPKQVSNDYGNSTSSHEILCDIPTQQKPQFNGRAIPYAGEGDFLSHVSNFKIIESTLQEGEKIANTFFDTAKKIEIAKALDMIGDDYLKLTSTATFKQSRVDCDTIYKLGLKAKILTHIRRHMDDARTAIQTSIDGFEVVADKISRNPTSTKMKKGLLGFVNGFRESAMADTGSAKNVMSAAYAADMKLAIKHSPHIFQLGNSRKIQSTGTVNIRWAFADDPSKIHDIILHVIPNLTYGIILGREFLTATETLSRYKRRITECVFSVSNYFKFCLLGDTCYMLEGAIEENLALAVPDTGAERNVIDAWYAHSLGLKIDTGVGTKNILQFADGSYQETIGQVHTTWTFANSKRVPITFEVLEDCASDVVLGEDFIYNNNIFEEHDVSLRILRSEINDAHELAPFDFITPWQRKCLELKSKFKKQTISSGRNFDSTFPTETERERQRRDNWNHRYEFGDNATNEEREAEQKRRREYEGGRKASERSLGRGCGNFPRVPIKPTASMRAKSWKSTGWNQW